MTDKHIPASKLLALPVYQIDGPDFILLSDLRAIIDQHKSEATMSEDAAEALALQPADVELSDIGYISEDGEEVFLNMGLPLDAETCGVPVTKLYTIKTKANTK